jgi:hypothetical protein
MTREEEIKQAAKNRADQYEHPVDWNNCYHHYIQGAEWADQHPRKGLVDIEKVIEYMKKNSRFNYLLETDWEVLEDLRKAMED